MRIGSDFILFTKKLDTLTILFISNTLLKKENIQDVSGIKLKKHFFIELFNFNLIIAIK